MDAEVRDIRQECVVEYLTWLETATHTSWEHVAREANLARRFVLCHPAWLQGASREPSALGLHGFVGGERGRKCQANLLWGYDCPLTEEEIQCDHLFPLSLGGPALGTNQVWLCQIHNQWKSSNLLEYPWERGEPQWLVKQIAEFAACIDPRLPMLR